MIFNNIRYKDKIMKYLKNISPGFVFLETNIFMIYFTNKFSMIHWCYFKLKFSFFTIYLQFNEWYCPLNINDVHLFILFLLLLSSLVKTFQLGLFFFFVLFLILPCCYVCIKSVCFFISFSSYSMLLKVTTKHSRLDFIAWIVNFDWQFYCKFSIVKVKVIIILLVVVNWLLSCTR